MKKSVLIGIIVGAVVLVGMIVGLVLGTPANNGGNTTTSHIHTIVIDPEVPADCMTGGLTEGKHCSVCGEIIVPQQEIPMIAHTYDNKYDDECNVCGYKRDAECRHFETEVIPGKAATCTTTGLSEGKKCSTCGVTTIAQKTVPALGHGMIVDDKAVAPTCTATGLTEGSHCSRCDHKVAQEVVPVLGHDYEAVITVPTCTTNGYTTYTCHCGDTYVDNEEGALGHNVGEWYELLAPTCTTNGTKQRDCFRCDYNEVIGVPATEHTFGKWITVNNPTTTHEGLKERTCACGEVEQEVIPVLVPSKGLVYTWNNDGLSCSVTGIGTCTDTDIVIPDTYNGLPVTSIGKHAFSDCNLLTSITIPDSVTSILSSAFSFCDSLTSVIIPDSVTSIGVHAFISCKSLTSVTIPNSVTSIADNTFYGCSSLTSIEVAKNNEHFKSIDGNLYTKDGKTLIQYAIGKPNRSFVIPDSVTSVGDYAFYNCKSLQYNKYDNAYYLGNGNNPYFILIKAKNKSITSCEIHNSTKLIYTDAFYNCKSLTNITIPDSVTRIGREAFGFCISLTSVEIGDSVTSIGNRAFSFCDLLTSVEIGDTVTSIGDHAFWKCTALTNITIPDSVTSIGSDAFSGCRSLTSVIIGNSVTKIGGWAFYECTALTSITIPDSVTSIGELTFYGCTSLASVEIGDSVTSIGKHAFSDCNLLTSITIPDSVTSIGVAGFSQCFSLTSINFEGTVEQWSAISKGVLWNYNTGNYIVHCINGAISK